MRRRRWRSRTGKAGSKKKVFFLILVLLTFFSLQSFIFVEKNLRPPLMNVAKIRLKQIATQAINRAVSERIAQGTNFDKLVDWKTDKSDRITGFMLNYAEHMKISAETIGVVTKVLGDLKELNEHMPLGQAMNSAILSNFGPNIPIRLIPAGAVQVDLSTRETDAGINMILVEVYLKVTVEVTIIIPFDTESEVVQTEIPISYMLVVGDVPMYYFDNKGNPLGNNGSLPPSVTLPEIKSKQDENNNGSREQVDIQS